MHFNREPHRSDLGNERGFPGGYGTFDELNNADLHPLSQRADGHTKGCGRFAFAGTGMDDDQSFLDVCFGQLAVLDFIQADHSFFVLFARFV